MPNFQFIVSDPTTRKAYKIEIDQAKAIGLIGKVIGDRFNGDIVGLPGYELQITGGTDKDGFPMHPQVHGPGKKKVILSHPPCFHPKLKGQRKRKTVRGNTISRDIVQINCKIVKAGSKPIEQLLPKEKKEPEEKVEKPKEEKPKEKPKEEGKPEEKKPEEKPKEEKKVEKKPEKKKEPKKEKKEGEEVRKEESKP
jgi:small subunit ribosomal protein S6e